MKRPKKKKARRRIALPITIPPRQGFKIVVTTSPTESPRVDEFTWHVPLDEPAPKRTTPEPPPFRESIEHPGGCINVQGVQKAVRLDLLDWSSKRFVWEWMDVETATKVRDALTKAIEAAS